MAKNGSAKIVIAIVLAAGIGLGFYLFKAKEQELLSATMQGLDIGEAYGRVMAQKDCVAGLRMQHGQCDDNVCALSAHGFIAGCMRSAEKDSFCAGVPAPSDSQAAIGWAGRTCLELKMANTKCEDYIHKVLAVCYEQNTGKKRDTSEIIRDGFNKGYQKSQ